MCVILSVLQYFVPFPHSQGYGEKKAYIASQDPIRTNFVDFWRMI